MKNVSVIIPTLNEVGNIEKVLMELLKFKFINEILIIDAHSTDGTLELVRKFSKKHKKIKLELQRGEGKGSALREGFEKFSGEIVLIMDADLSHDTKEIPDMVQPIVDGKVDAVLASRFLKGGGSEDITKFRTFGNMVFCFLVNSFWDVNYTDLCYGYRAFKKEVIEKLNLESDGFEIETEISIEMAKKGIKFMEIPSFEYARRSGKGKLETFRDGWRILFIILKKLLSD